MSNINPAGQTTLFYQGPAGLGLTTALGLLKAGFVIVGNLPTTNGSCSTATAGSLLVLDRNGNLVTQIANPVKLNGPWDMTINDQGSSAQLFVSDVLSGEVVRIDMAVSPVGIAIQKATIIASGYAHRCDAAALVVGPTGLVYLSDQDLLFVRLNRGQRDLYDTRSWHEKHRRRHRYCAYRDDAHLHGPLGMAMSPNGHLIVSNSDVINPDPDQTSELVEFGLDGTFISELSVDPNPGGSFGLAFSVAVNGTVRFAAVDDNVPNITIWNLRIP